MCEQTLKGMTCWLSYPIVETPVGSDDMKVSNITWFVRKWSILVYNTNSRFTAIVFNVDTVTCGSYEYNSDC